MRKSRTEYVLSTILPTLELITDQFYILNKTGVYELTINVKKYLPPNNNLKQEEKEEVEKYVLKILTERGYGVSHLGINDYKLFS